MLEYLYRIHGVGLRFATDSPAVAAAGQTLLRHFRRETSDGPIALELTCTAVRRRSDVPVTVSSSARELFTRRGLTVGDALRSEWKCDLYRDQDRMVADFHDQGLLLIDDQRGRVNGYLVEPDAMHQDVRASYLHFALTELLKRQGLYRIHATALEKRGRGLLIPGNSGRGKTTACLALLRAGYRFLSDDHPLVRENGTGLDVLSFPAKIDVTDTTTDFFPELRAAKESFHQGVRKRFFYVEDVYPDANTDCCEPALLIFPQIMDWPKSRLEPLPKSRALEALLPQGLLVYDVEVAKRQFQILSRLVEQAGCYRLYFGEDILDLPQLIDPLMEKS